MPVVLVLGLVQSASAAYLNVDLAYHREHFPSDPDKEERYLKTAKPGWMSWEENYWADLWTHDPRTFSDVDGSGINITVGYGYEGHTTMQIFGMTGVGDGEVADGLPEGDPIANSYVFNGKNTTWGNDPNTSRPYWGSLFLILEGEGLAPGSYTLTSYHNDANNPALSSGAYPTRVPPPFDFMPKIIIEKEGESLIERGWVYSKLSSLGVIQIHDEETVDINVPIQHVTSDAELVPSVIKFYYDGFGPVTVHYMASIGGCAVLNAFILDGGVMGPAVAPNPMNGAENVHPDVLLKWKPGPYAVSHDVYFGTDWDDVNDGTGGTSKGNQLSDMYDAGRLDLDTTYYWRIDEINDVNDDSPWKGAVWRFTTTDGKASSPSPGDGAGGISPDVVLSWTAGMVAASHDVYLGTNADDVEDANASSPEYKGNQDVADTNYAPPGLLELGWTYYWRIDEINPGFNTDSKGDVWSFKVLDYLVVDDMESYDEVSNKIQDTWIDGWVNWSGSEVSLGRLEDEDPVHDGNQSMIFNYDNKDTYGYDLDYYSEAKRTFDEPQDWTIEDVKALVLYFYGDPCNVVGATEQLNLALEDEDGPGPGGVVPYHGDLSDIQEDEWHQWSINLKDPCLVAANVNPDSIKSISIIIGDRSNKKDGGTPGGIGVVYFDDIRLAVPRCLPWAPKHPADFNGDCIVDIDDLGIMVDDWLEHDYTVAAQAPGPSVLQYNFDETYGGIADDSSSNNYDGKAKDINDLAVEAIWQTGGKSGGCIRFDKTNNYALEVPVAAFNSHINNQITLTMWLNWDNPDTMPAETNQLFSVHSGISGVIGVETEWKAGRLRFWDIGAGTTYTAREQDWSGGWNHYAFVKDVTAGYRRIYLNGKLVAKSSSTASMTFPVTLARIGMATDSWHDDYTGLVDDFRIYNSALSDAEIAHVITGGPDLYIPIDTPVNLYDKEPANSRAVNFKDYAELMNSWLDELLWPAE